MQDGKYFGKVAKVETLIQGNKIVRVFTLKKDYTLSGAEHLLSGKQAEYLKRLRRAQETGVEDKGIGKFERDLVDLETKINVLKAV